MKTIGVIGLGSIGMRHAKNLLKMGHFVKGYDPNEERRDIFTVMSHGKRGATYLNIPIESDAIVIASPTNCHFDQIVEVNRHGKKIFAEKPIAHGYNSTLASVLMVGYNLRFHSCVKKAKEWMPLIGSPVWAHFTCAQYNDKPDYLRDGVILNWSHEIDLALYLLGAAQVAASSTRLTDLHDDMSDILLTHDNGCRSMIHLDYLTKPERRGFTIVGTEGRIAVNLVQRVARLKVNGDKISFTGNDSWDDNYKEEMQAFIDRIDGKETLGCTGAEALEVLKICLEVRKQAGI